MRLRTGGDRVRLTDPEISNEAIAETPWNETATSKVTSPEVCRV